MYYLLKRIAIRLLFVFLLPATILMLVSPIFSQNVSTSQLSARSSPFYKFDIVAQSGQTGLVGIEDNPSINDTGLVAFVGKLDEDSNIEDIFVGDGSGPPRRISTFDRNFSRAVQINNNNQVAARDSEGFESMVRL